MSQATLAGLVGGKLPASALPDDVGSQRNMDTIVGRGAVVVARTRGMLSFTRLLSGPDTPDNTHTEATYETVHRIAHACRTLYFIYPAWYGASALSPLPNDFELKVVPSVVTTQPQPHFLGTTREVWLPERRKLVKPGDIPVFGPLDHDFVAGDILKLRAYVKVATQGLKWPANYYGAGVMGSDKSEDAEFIAENGLFAPHPTAIVGIPTGASDKSVAILGDSIGQSGASEAGFWATGFGLGVPIMNLSVQTDEAQRFIRDLEQRGIRMSLAVHATNILWQFGKNDFREEATLDKSTTMIDNLITVAKMFKARRKPFFATTITPQTTSTDGWATVGNQTRYLEGFHLTKVGYNDWLRDGAPLFADTLLRAGIGASGSNVIRAGETDDHLIAYEDCPPSPGCTNPGYFDIADAVESARNSGIWKAGYSADGVHLNTVNASAAVAAKLSPTPLR